MTPNKQIDLPLEEIVAFSKRHPIKKLSLFGSVLRDDFGPDSDVDVLVEFEPGAGISYFDLADMKFELEDLIGREVDLLTPNALGQYFRQKVFDRAVALYERE